MAAAAAITPRVRLMAVCDGVRESKAEDGVFNLKGVRRRIVATSFPYVPARLWLFLQLSSSRQGVFPSYVRIVNDRTDKCVFHAKSIPLRHLRTPISFGRHVIRFGVLSQPRVDTPSRFGFFKNKARTY